MYDVDAVAAFDRENVADIKARQGRINEDGRAAGLKITDVRTWRVLMPWRGTKRWDGSAEGFSFAEFETDQGLVGVAEGLSSEADALRSRVLGKNPSNRRSAGSWAWPTGISPARSPASRSANTCARSSNSTRPWSRRSPSRPTPGTASPT